MSVIDLTIGRATNDVLEAAVAVHFKDEDEIGGVATGPIWIEAKDEPTGTPLLYAFHLPDQSEWFPVTDAEALAAELSVPLERS